MDKTLSYFYLYVAGTCATDCKCTWGHRIGIANLNATRFFYIIAQNALSFMQDPFST